MKNATLEKSLCFRQAVKVALAVTISTFIITFFHFHLLALIAPLSSLVIMTIFQYQTIMSGIQRILGPAITTTLALFFLNIAHNPIFYIVCILAILLIGGYLFAMEFLGYAALMGSLIGAVVFATGFKNPHLAYEFGYHFALQSAIGVVVAWCVTHLILPIKPTTHLLPKLADLYAKISAQQQNPKATNTDLFAGITQVLNVCKNVLTKKAAKFYLHQIIKAKLLYLTNNTLIRSLRHIAQQEDLAFLNDDIRELYAGATDMLEKLSQGILEECHVNIDYITLNEKTSSLNQRIQQLRQDDIFYQLTTMQTVELISIISEIKSFSHSILKEIELHNLFVKKQLGKQALLSGLQQEKERLFPINPDGLKRAFKLTLTIAIVFTMHFYYGWYGGGIQAIITSTVVAAQANMGLAQHKFILRLFGIIIGGITGLFYLFLLSHITSFVLLLAMMFFTTLLFAQITLGSPKYSYFGLQAALMLPLILLTSQGPVTDISIALQRFSGVIEGGVIAFLVTAFIYPMNPIVLLRRKLGKGFHACADLLKLTHAQQLDSVILRQSIVSSVNGAQALLNDAQGLDQASDEKSLSEVLVILQNSLEQFIPLAQSVAQKDQHPLINIITQKLDDITSALAKHYDNAAKALIQEDSSLQSISPLTNSFRTTIRALRKEHITAQYELNELQRYTTYANSIYRLLKNLKRLAHVIGKP